MAPTNNMKPVPRKLSYLRAFDESCVKIKAVDRDQKSPRYNKPIMYTLTFKGAEGEADVTVDVHWHRVLHVADNRGNSEIYGRSRMQNVFNRLYDLRKVLGGSGEMFWKGGFPGLSMEVNPDMTDVDFDEKSIAEQVQKYDRGLQRYLALQGVTAKSLSVQVADPSKHIECAMRSIAVTLGVPFRIFLGSEQAQLASEQDTKSWNRRLRKRQTKYITPFLLRPFVDRLIAFNVLPVPAEADPVKGITGYHVHWPDLGAPTDSEKAKVGLDRTSALTSYVSSGLSSLIPPKEYLTLVLGYDDETAESIVNASEDFADYVPPGTEDPADAEADKQAAKKKKGKGGKPALNRMQSRIQKKRKQY